MPIITNFTNLTPCYVFVSGAESGETLNNKTSVLRTPFIQDSDFRLTNRGGYHKADQSLAALHPH